jgi:hypothetical protein
MTTYYVITETRQTGGAPRVHNADLYVDRTDAVEDAAELTRRAREVGRRESYDVWELVHDYNASYDYEVDVEAATA